MTVHTSETEAERDRLEDINRVVFSINLLN